MHIIIVLIISFSLAILVPVGIILGIVFTLKISDTEDQLLKKKNRRRMWWSFLTPFIIIVFTLIIYGLLSVINSTIGY
ncbi:MAG: hypothetical protein AAB637_01955 [Patescibacteria group bacterium]